MKRILSLSIAFLVALGAAASAAGDEGLYDAPPPPGSAFIRVLNAGAEASGFDMSIGGASIAVGAHSLTPYAVTKAGMVNMLAPGLNETIEIEAGKFYTYGVGALPGAKNALFIDDKLGDPAKARLYFYNLTELDGVALHVPAAKQDALKDVKTASANSIELRAPLQVDVVARGAAGDLFSYGAVKLKRRGGTSLVLSGTAGNYSGFAVANTIAK